jgi:hypothetical protein
LFDPEGSTPVRYFNELNQLATGKPVPVQA